MIARLITVEGVTGRKPSAEDFQAAINAALYFLDGAGADTRPIQSSHIAVLRHATQQLAAKGKRREETVREQTPTPPLLAPEEPITKTPPESITEMSQADQEKLAAALDAALREQAKEAIAEARRAMLDGHLKMQHRVQIVL